MIVLALSLTANGEAPSAPVSLGTGQHPKLDGKPHGLRAQHRSERTGTLANIL